MLHGKINSILCILNVPKDYFLGTYNFHGRELMLIKACSFLRTLLKEKNMLQMQCMFKNSHTNDINLIPNTRFNKTLFVS